MFSLKDTIRSHPFAVEAFFKNSLVLTFSLPQEDIAHLLPPCLTADAFNDHAFIAVAMVQTNDLRPKGFPALMGNDFFLIGYRIFVRYTTSEGKRLRGLYILKSETDNKRMTFFGNIFTHYNYTTTDISFKNPVDLIEVFSEKSGLDIAVNISEDPPLPPESIFSSWKEARRFEGPLPFTFTVDAVKKEVLIIEGVRQKWVPTPVEIVRCNNSFIDKFKRAKPANAFLVRNIPYYWKRGRKDKCLN